MSLDVIYLAWNRLEYTKVTFPLLVANTDWSLVDRLIVYEDGSKDGTREYLDGELAKLRRSPDGPAWGASLSYLGYRSPIKTMLNYLGGDPAERFAKIDSDIACPPGWLEALTGVMDASPELELLGMQIGFGGDPPESWDGVYRWEPCSHIGGVGLMRSSAFTTREQLQPAGRFGFTAWQQRNDPVRGWLAPDVLCPQLDLLPVGRWPEVASRYREAGWQREWPPYDRESARYWAWIEGIE